MGQNFIMKYQQEVESIFKLNNGFGNIRYKEKHWNQM